MDYSQLVKAYNKVESTSKRIEKTWEIQKLLKATPDELLDEIILLLQGTVFPVWDSRKLGVASQLMQKAIATATGMNEKEIIETWKNTGDLGLVAEELVKKKKQVTLFQRKLSVEKVYSNIQKVASMGGAGTVNRKVQLIAELLTSASPNEAKYIARTLLGVLRIGVGEGALRDSIVWAFLPKVLGVFFLCECGKIVPQWNFCLECGKENPSGTEAKGEIIEKVEELKNVKTDIVIPKSNPREFYNYLIERTQDAYNLTNDFGRVAKVLKKSGLIGLDTIELELGNPIKVMLALKVDSVEEGFERVGVPALVDHKYDGFRMQVHKSNGKVRLFTRRLEEVTKQFAEVAQVVLETVKGDSFVIDGEAIGFDPKTSKYKPFQDISQRIKRKYDIEEIAKKLPVELNIFDCVYYNGKNLIKEPLEKRRALVEKIINPIKWKIQIATAKKVSTAKEATEFFDGAMKLGHEGIMFKNLSAPYKPGGRVGYMCKFKPSMAEIDLVITGAEWGEGKRSAWLTSYDLALLDGDTLLKVGKASTGLKEKSEEGLSFSDMTNLLKPLITKTDGKHVTVEPKIIVEVGYQEIQKSPTYSSGFALRFPTVIRLREDKALDEIASRSDIILLFKK